MKKKIVYIVICIISPCFLSACNDYESQAWQKAPEEYTCTTEQMGKAQAEAKWCKGNTGYLDTYCYGTAIIRNCIKNKID